MKSINIATSSTTVSDNVPVKNIRYVAAEITTRRYDKKKNTRENIGAIQGKSMIKRANTPKVNFAALSCTMRIEL